MQVTRWVMTLAAKKEELLLVCYGNRRRHGETKLCGDSMPRGVNKGSQG